MLESSGIIIGGLWAGLSMTRFYSNLESEALSYISRPSSIDCAKVMKKLNLKKRS